MSAVNLLESPGFINRNVHRRPAAAAHPRPGPRPGGSQRAAGRRLPEGLPAPCAAGRGAHPAPGAVPLRRGRGHPGLARGPGARTGGLQLLSVEPGAQPVAGLPSQGAGPGRARDPRRAGDRGRPLRAGAPGRGRLRAGRGGAGLRLPAGGGRPRGKPAAAALHPRPPGPPGGNAQPLCRRRAGGQGRRAAVPGNPARLPAPLQLLLLRQAVSLGAPLSGRPPAGGVRPGARARGAGDLPDGPLVHLGPRDGGAPGPPGRLESHGHPPARRAAAGGRRAGGGPPHAPGRVRLRGSRAAVREPRGAGQGRPRFPARGLPARRGPAAGPGHPDPHRSDPGPAGRRPGGLRRHAGLPEGAWPGRRGRGLPPGRASRHGAARPGGLPRAELHAHPAVLGPARPGLERDGPVPGRAPGRGRAGRGAVPAARAALRRSGAGHHLLPGPAQRLARRLPALACGSWSVPRRTPGPWAWPAA